MRGNENPSSRDEVADGKVRVRWTASGVVFAVVGFVLFLVGMMRADGVMGAMGLAMGILLVWVRWLGVRNLVGMDLMYRGPRRVEAGKRFEARLELWNRRRILDGFRIDFGIKLKGERELRGNLGWVCAGGVAVVSERVMLKERGLKREHVGWVGSTFPLGLMRFLMRKQVDAEVGVLPGGKVPEELMYRGFLLDGLPYGGARQYGGMGEWKGLREWRSGDAVKRIAWAASMRGGCGNLFSGRGLMVRQYEPPGSQVEVCVVVFHSLGGEKYLIRPDRFEVALGLLSGVLGHLQGMGVKVKFVADFRGWETMEICGKRQVAEVREELMFAKRAGWTEPHDLMEVVERVGAGECLVVISDMPAEAWVSVIPGMDLEPVVVDIVKHERRGRSGRRDLRSRKGGGR